MGGPGNGRGSRRRNITRERECVRLREQGLTLTEVGRRLDITAASVANALKRQGRPDLLGVSGFAGIDPERQREIARMGGRAAHAAGTAHQFTSQEARAAGSKGGKAAHTRGNAHVFTTEQAREAGKKGGRASWEGATAATRARVAEEARRQAEAGPRGRKGVTPAALARRAEMARLWAAGLTLAEIGERFSVTRQAVACALRAVEGAAGGER
jgi:DNA-binding CsgD family transcriptional regulator